VLLFYELLSGKVDLFPSVANVIDSLVDLFPSVANVIDAHLVLCFYELSPSHLLTLYMLMHCH
jgi:hypothetical protein